MGARGRHTESPVAATTGLAQLGVLEDVALSAHREGDGWVAPVGARAVAENLGMTKDTAAKALAALAAAGVVERVNVHTRDGKLRSGYRINLPEGVAFKVAPQADPEISPGDRGGHDSSRGENSDAPSRRGGRLAGRPVGNGIIGGLSADRCSFRAQAPEWLVSLAR